MSAFDKLKDKLVSATSSSNGNANSKGMDKLASDEKDFQRLKEKEEEKQRRQAEYERLGLEERTKFGTGAMRFG